MRTLIRKTTSYLGFEIRRAAKEKGLSWVFDPFAAQKFLLTQSMIESPVIFDIGAYRGETAQRYRSLFPNSTIYCFEPFIESFERLRVRFQNDKKIIPFPLAVTENAGCREFFVNRFDATNSLLRRPSTGRRYYHEAGTVKMVTEVSTTSIDEFIAAHPLETSALVKLDIQGGELSALRGAVKLLSSERAALLYVEVVFVPHYQRQPLFHEICAFLADFGYTLFNIYELHASDNGQLRMGDALFVNRQIRTEVIDRMPRTGVAYDCKFIPTAEIKAIPGCESS
jgi:FkbM family methyltransferase